MDGKPVALRSMTGFARSRADDDGVAWTWEARSVNAKGLDLRCRLPRGYDVLEGEVRKAVGRRLARGHVSVTLTIREHEARPDFRIDRTAFAAVAALARELGDLPGVAPPTLDGLLRLPGVIESNEGEPAPDEARRELLLASLEELLDGLAERREAEGAALSECLDRLIDEIAGLVGRAEAAGARQPGRIRDRLERRLADLAPGGLPVAEERLAQEVALLAMRADIREETERMKAHIGALRDGLRAGGALGRRLGFLAQELLREANTLCSKSVDRELTALGLELKLEIDRLREQALNVE